MKLSENGFNVLQIDQIENLVDRTQKVVKLMIWDKNEGELMHALTHTIPLQLATGHMNMQASLVQSASGVANFKRMHAHTFAVVVYGLAKKQIPCEM